MNGLVQLVRNLVYLSKFSLKTVMKFPYFGLNLQYLIEDIAWRTSDSDIKKPKIYNSDETLNVILNTKMSLARFGDGELEIISGNDIPYQKYDKKLAEGLKNVLKNKQDNLLVGINYDYFHYTDLRKLDNVSKEFSLYSVPKYRNRLLEYIDFERQYGSAGIAVRQSDRLDFYEKFKEVFKNKEIVVVACREAINSLKYNIFDCAKNIDYIFVPNINAYEKYNQILNDIKKFSKEKMIILMAGPASKVLASDLTYLGYRALDLGHLAKGYDFVKRQVPITPESTVLFFKPDY